MGTDSLSVASCPIFSLPSSQAPFKSTVLAEPGSAKPSLSTTAHGNKLAALGLWRSSCSHLSRDKAPSEEPRGRRANALTSTKPEMMVNFLQAEAIALPLRSLAKGTDVTRKESQIKGLLMIYFYLFI